MKRIIISFVIMFSISCVFSQEVLTGLQVNPVIKTNSFKNPDFLKSDFPAIPVINELPFLDDFSSTDVFPSSSRWLDRYAFINSDYPLSLVTIGAATLDAINDKGEIYENANSYQFTADSLTSVYIRLDTTFLGGTPKPLNISDSLYLSFYYQPGGGNDTFNIGNKPDAGDSLVLEFAVPYGDSTNMEADRILLPGDSVWVPENNEWLNVDSYLHDTIALLPDDKIWCEACSDSVIITSILFPGDSIKCSDLDTFWVVLDSAVFDTIDLVLLPGDIMENVKITRWDRIWSTEGISLDTLYARDSSLWGYVMIPIVNPMYLTNKFQLRFRNYASLAEAMLPSWAGNADQWHIDYIYLNTGRSDTNQITNKIIVDVAFTNKMESLLKYYQAMPWSQYKVDTIVEVKDSLRFDYKNFNTDARSLNRNIEIIDILGSNPTIKINPSGAQLDIMPLVDSTRYMSLHGYFYPKNQNDSAEFELIGYYGVSPDTIRYNDTIRFYQKFYNYYAYDDGTPENGYGLSVDGAKLAYQFTLNKSDSLVGVQMFFNQVKDSANQKAFKIKIWSNNSGIPGSELYSSSVTVPFFADSLNEYYTYNFPEFVPVSGTFYIGWEQTTNDILNVGFDRNINSQDKIFYNIDNTWYNTMYEGSLMIRPVLGSELLSGIKENKKQDFHCIIYPNPLNGNIFNIKLPDGFDADKKFVDIEIYSIMGNLLYKNHYKEQVDVSGFANGIYFVRVVNMKENLLFSDKLVISR